MSPWQRGSAALRSPCTSSGRLTVDASAAARLWLSATSLPPIYIYGNVGPHWVRSGPFFLEEFGAMGHKTVEFFHEFCMPARREDRPALEAGSDRPVSARTWSSSVLHGGSGLSLNLDHSHRG
eukprot:jgi/Mesvir1/19336/Mv10394-RA.1